MAFKKLAGAMSGKPQPPAPADPGKTAPNQKFKSRRNDPAFMAALKKAQDEQAARYAAEAKANVAGQMKKPK